MRLCACFLQCVLVTGVALCAVALNSTTSSLEKHIAKSIKQWYNDTVLATHDWSGLHNELNNVRTLFDNLRQFIDRGNELYQSKCYDRQSINESVLEWSYNVDNALYYSHPLCLDSNKNYILRKCSNGNFLGDQPECAFLQDSKPLPCVEGLQPIRLGNMERCFIILGPAPYENSTCPYHYQLFDSRSKDMWIWAKNLSVTRPMWMQYHRWSEHSRFYIAEMTVHHGETVDMDVQPEGGDCVVLENGRLLQRDCSMRYHRLCVYSPRLDWQYCKWANLTCINRDMNTTNLKCICPTETHKCGQPAQLMAPNQNVGIFSRNECGMNLRTQNGTWLWAPNALPVTETFWAYWELRGTRSDTITWKGFGWTTQQSPTDYDDCTMCEVDFAYALPQLEINEKELTLINEISLYSSIDRTPNPNINCFSNSAGATKISSSAQEFNAKLTNLPNGIYWCVAFEVKHFTKVISNKYVVAKNAFYIFSVQVRREGIGDPYEYAETLKNDIIKRLYLDVGVNCTDVSIIDTNLIYEFRLDDHQLPHEYNPMAYRSWKKHLFELNLNVTNVYDYFFCDAFTRTSPSGVLQIWPETLAGKSSVSQNLCVDINGNDVLINCNTSYMHGARFSSPDDCYVVNDTTAENKSEYTDELIELQNSEEQPNRVVGKVAQITNNAPTLQPIDIFLVANILHKNNKEVNASVILKVLNNLFAASPHVLNIAQSQHNATDKILCDFDAYLNTVPLKAGNAEEVLVSERIVSVILDLCTSKYRGAAYSKTGRIVLLDHKTNLTEWILNTNNTYLSAFISIPTLHCNVVNGSHAMKKASISFMLSNVLFNSNDKWGSRPLVASVLVPPDISSLNTLVAVDGNTTEENSCGFWLYGANVKGKWMQNGRILFRNNMTTICEYDHATHYGQLVGRDIPMSADELRLFTTTTYVECALSTFGIAALFVTAFVSPEWRAQTQNCILLHYSVVLLGQMILLFLADAMHDRVDGLCVVIGALLHFTVLAQFAWTLLISVRYYAQLVIVFVTWEMSVWRCMFYAYVIPTLIVSACAFLAPRSYIGADIQMCYPSGGMHIIAVLAPIAMALVCNLYVFIRIWVGFCLSSIHTTNLKHTNTEVKLFLRLFVCLFFMLGLTWVFAIAAHFLESVLCLYLFIFSVTIQGFFMFIYFLVFNSDVRKMYKRRFAALYFERF